MNVCMHVCMYVYMYRQNRSPNIYFKMKPKHVEITKLNKQ